jgi:hypothetical protein
VGWIALTTAGFVLATSLVIALARPATARWEAEDEATSAPPPGRGGAAPR